MKSTPPTSRGGLSVDSPVVVEVSAVPSPSASPEQAVHGVAVDPHEADELHGDPHEHVTNTERAITLTFVVVPFVGVVLAIALLWGVGVDWFHVAQLGVMYLLTALGISVGYHRLFSHKAFKTHAFMRVFFAIIGAMAAEGTVRRFVANHRRHHGHSDRDGDPHSPHHHDGGVWNTVKGFVYAHVGWFLLKRPHPDEKKYAPEFCKDNGKNGVTFVDSTNWLWVTAGLAIPTVLGGVWGALTDGTWISSAFLGLLWGGIVRIFIVHHVTWSVNSVCHLWGTRPFKSGDHSRNNAIFGFLGVGEGWHNNHHAFPSSARHGLRWWEFDAGYVLVKMLSWVGLAWDVRTPAKTQLQRAQAKAEG